MKKNRSKKSCDTVLLRSPGIDVKESISPGRESIPELLRRFANSGSGYTIGHKQRECMGVLEYTHSFLA
jgi:hypothetical protein